MRTMDLIEPRFRQLYDKICVGNKPENAQWVFFEGMLLEEGLGTDLLCKSAPIERVVEEKDMTY